jgi:dTDP-4-dehydrorhamnose 3,5-epimerase
MKFTQTEIAGAFTIDIEKHEDERGFFARSWCVEECASHGLATDVNQMSVSMNHVKGTLRGMHYQTAPFQETKIVRCTHGRIYDVALDLRPDSRTFLRWTGVELSAENHRMLYIPEGCAHGFLTREDASEIFYQISVRYAPDHARGVRWDDPAFGIRWPEEPRVISDRDRQYPDFHSTTRPE